MNMTKGEFHSVSAIHGVTPEFVPKPIACGTYENIPDTHFFLCDFREMAEEMPDPHKFASGLSIMHQKSVSPTGKFGFHTTTYAGNLPQYVAWEDSWASFFAKSMRQALDLEIGVKGNSDELEVLSQTLFKKVIPRLLRPLESDGRTVKPSLIHGDLWHANAGIDAKSNQPIIFDACCFFAHNECMFPPSTGSFTLLTSLTRQMSLDNGNQHVIGLEMSTSLPTTNLSRFRHLKRTLKVGWTSIGCE